MVIDFLGVPGVGKTTLATGLVSELRHRGYDVAFQPIDRSTCGNRYGTLLYHLSRIARFAVCTPHQAWPAVSLWRLFPQPGRLRILRYWLYTHAFAADQARRAPIVILDQGFCQGLFSWALRSSAPAGALAAAVARMPPPDVLVVVTAPPAETRVRLMRRRNSFSRLKGLVERDPVWLERADALVGSIVRAVQAETGCAVINQPAPAGVPVAVTSRRLAEELGRRLPYDAPAPAMARP